MIRNITEDPEPGRVYQGKVRSVVTFGAFVEIVPGRDGLLHISEIDHHRVARTEDVLNVGDMVMVKVIGVDRDGKIKLSRKALLPEPEGGVPAGAGGRRRRRRRDGARETAATAVATGRGRPLDRWPRGCRSSRGRAWQGDLPVRVCGSSHRARTGTARARRHDLDRGSMSDGSTKTVLPSGLTVLTEAMPDRRSVSVGRVAAERRPRRARRAARRLALHRAHDVQGHRAPRRARDRGEPRVARRPPRRVHRARAGLLLRPRARRAPAGGGRRARRHRVPLALRRRRGRAREVGGARGDLRRARTIPRTR